MVVDLKSSASSPVDQRTCWSRDRNRLVIVVDRPKVSHGSQRTQEQTAGYLRLLDVPSRQTRRLTADHQDSDPAWSPDGSEIAFIRGATQLWAVDARSPAKGKAGTRERKIVDLADLRQPFAAHRSLRYVAG